MFISPNLQVTLMYLDAVLSTRVLQLCVWRTVSTWPRWATEHLAMGLTRFMSAPGSGWKPSLISCRPRTQQPEVLLWTEPCSLNSSMWLLECASRTSRRLEEGGPPTPTPTPTPGPYLGPICVCGLYLLPERRCQMQAFSISFHISNAISCLRLYFFPQLEWGSPSFLFAGKSKLQQNQRRRQS